MVETKFFINHFIISSPCSWFVINHVPVGTTVCMEVSNFGGMCDDRYGGRYGGRYGDRCGGRYEESKEVGTAVGTVGDSAVGTVLGVVVGRHTVLIVNFWEEVRLLFTKSKSINNE